MASNFRLVTFSSLPFLNVSGYEILSNQNSPKVPEALFGPRMRPTKNGRGRISLLTVDGNMSQQIAPTPLSQTALFDTWLFAGFRVVDSVPGLDPPLVTRKINAS